MVSGALSERHRLLGDHRRNLIGRRDGAMRAARGRPSKLGKNESLTEAVEAARAKLAELAADRHAVASAPLPSSAVKGSIRNQVAVLAAAGEPNIAKRR